MVNNDALDERGSTPTPARSENLALLYQGILTAIVRVQSGKQQIVDANAFQKRMESLLAEIQREAIKLGYRNQDVEDANYAIVAFLDETIQQSNDPARNQWSSLQAKMYAQAVAGDQVYDRLKVIRTRRESPDLADLMEVYCLCLLLGYEGRYALADRAELSRLTEDLREQIDRIRGRGPALSPEGSLPAAQPAPVVAPASGAGIWKTVAIACLVFAVVSWIALKLLLSSYAQDIVNAMSP